MADEKVIPVRVALRCRPLVTKEIVEGCQMNVYFEPDEPQVVLGSDKRFTFDYTFNTESIQKEIYDTSVADRIEYIFKGYNVTILAYGQTGSGKTYTMGTGYSSTIDDESQNGVIQRAVRDIFNGIEKRSSTNEFLVKVSFLEVYKEDIIDLLQKSKDNTNTLAIREDSDGIKIVGLTEQPVRTVAETFQALEQGSLSRTTAATNMNSRSSRSHGIFSIIIEQRSLTDPTDFVKSKFHLVDLAGSERANKTGAMGERFKEGVNINKGLLALGNVISALGDESSHIPYRDSKLTRLLQDSLGGNSHTVMIACISPADSNFEETLNTVRYADRARKIKNKPIINRDPQNNELLKLRQEIQQLKIQLMQNQVVGQEGQGDVRVLLERNETLETANGRLTKELQSTLSQVTTLCEKLLVVELGKEKLVHQLEELNAEMQQALDICDTHPVYQQLLDLQKKIINLICERVAKDKEFSEYSPKKEDEEEVMVEEENSELDLTLRQAAMSRELQELERALALKEELATKMVANDSQMSVMRRLFETNLKQMEGEISLLHKEKEELAQALKAATASKGSDQRRKRLQECEAEIARLKKDIAEKSRIMKLKEEAQRKVDTLQQEIQTMKTTRVRLLKRMKEDANRYRQMNQAKEREVAQLRQKDRKKEYAITKMKRDFEKQKCVFKRKMEEATAANKRLNEALQQQKMVASRRMKEKQNSLQGIGTRVQQWLQQEMEVEVRSKEACFYLQNLIEDRKMVSEQLIHLKKKYEDNVQSDNEIEENERKQIKQLEEDIELRNKEIKNLQANVTNVDPDAALNRWSSIQSLVEAQCALKWLFEKSITSQMEVFYQQASFKQKLDEQESQVQEYATKIRHLQEEKEKFKNEKHDWRCEIAKLKREHEDKSLYFMKQLSCNATVNHSDSEAHFKERIECQDREINNLRYLNEETKKKDMEIQYLHEQLKQLQQGSKPKLMQPLLNKTYEKSVKPQKKVNSVMEEYLDEDSTEDTDNDENDPDWRATPFSKRTKSRQVKSRENDDSGSSSDSPKRKRIHPDSSSTGVCKCQGTCNTKRCKCKKSRIECSSFCKCDQGRCINQSFIDKSNNSDSEIAMKDTQPSSVLTEIIRNSIEERSSLHDFVAPKKAVKTKTADHPPLNESGIKKRALFPQNRSTPIFPPLT